MKTNSREVATPNRAEREVPDWVGPPQTNVNQFN
jgi:hypothetical protein